MQSDSCRTPRIALLVRGWWDGYNRTLAMIEAAEDYQQRVCDDCDLRAESEKLRAELEQVKRERDAAVECINTVYSYILIKSKTDAVRTIEKWLRGQKED